MNSFEHISPTVDIAWGDCLELMREIPSGSVDMVLCDLPYGTTRNAWDSVIPFEPLWTEWRRVCKRNAAIVLFSQMPFTVKLVMSNPKEFRYEWIYEKTNASGFLNAQKMPMKCHENVLVFYSALPIYNPQYTSGEAYVHKSTTVPSENYRKGLQDQLTINNGNRFPRDVLNFSNVSYGPDKGLHPTQKPVALLEYLIRTYTNPNNTVLDNCMGSGSTGVACINTDRRFVGIEIDDTYYTIAKKRLQETAAQTKLFACEE